MNKRILSFLLVLCMILVSVPVFALSTAAAEATGTDATRVYEYMSSYTDYLPTAGGANGTEIIYPGAWTLGNKWKDTGVSSFALMNWVGNSGNYNGIGTRSNAFVNVYNTVNQKNFYGPFGAVGAAPNEDAAVRYTAEKAGVIDIFFDKLGNVAQIVGGTYQYAVYVDGAKVWPADSDWYTITKVENGKFVMDGETQLTCYDDVLVFDETTLVAKDIVVVEGSVVDFICRTSTAINTTWTTGGNVMFPTIAYSIADATVLKTSFNSTTNLPVLNADGTVTTSGGWIPMSYPLNAPLSGAAMDKKNVNITGDYISATGDGDGGGTPGMLLQNAQHGVNGNYHAVVGQVNPIGGAKGAGVRYTVQNGGLMSVDFSKLGKYTNSTYTGDYTLYRYGIYINGSLVWPVQGGNLTDAPALSQAQNTNVKALSNVAVVAGDVVDFVCYKTGAWTNGWSGGGQVMFPDISIVSTTDTYSTSFNADTNFPTYTGSGSDVTVNWSGNWTVHAYAPNAGYGLEDAANGLILNREQGQGGAWVGNGLSLEDTRGSAWAGRASLITTAFNGTYFSEKGQITTGAGSTAAIRYTAEETGYANITIDRLANTTTGSKGDFTYSVYVNGNKLWSTTITTVSGTAYGNVTTTGSESALSGIYLVEGDRVEFVIETTGADIWAGSGSIFFGSVKYYNLTEKYAPTGANVNVAVTDSFTANGAGVTVPENVLNVTTGFIVNGEKLGATDALFSMAAKDIDTEVTVTPYYETSYGSVVTGTPVTTSIKTLLEGYLSDATYGDAAAAALSYAATAKAYFQNAATPVAPTVLPTGTYTDQLGVTEMLEDARVIPQQAALLLKDTASFKFTVNGALEGDQMEITDGTNTAVVTIVDGVAIFDGIGVKNWNTLYSFRVLDAEGNAVSSTFTYSVSTYYARMGAENTNLTNLVNAMMAFYEAAAAL